MEQATLITSSTEFEQAVSTALGHGVRTRRCWDERWADAPAAEVVAAVGVWPVVVIGPGVPVGSALAIAAEYDAEHPEVVVVLGGQPSPGVLPQAMRAGVRDVLDDAASNDEIRRVLGHAARTAERRLASLGREVETVNPSRVISVVSPKGGAGKTTVTTNLAVSLGRTLPNEVAVIDLDLQFGDVAAAMQLRPEHSIKTLLRSTEHVDDAVLRVFMTSHPSGALVLCSPEELVDAEEISYDDAVHVLSLTRAAFPTVIVDTSAGLDELALAAMEHSTDLVFVCTMDVASVRCLRKELDAVDRLGLDGVRRHFVLNRADARVGLNVADVEEAIGMRVDAAIPSTRAIPLAMNQGTPVVESDPRSAVARQFEQLAARFVPFTPTVSSAGANGSGPGVVSPLRRGWRKAAG